ncbi:MAG TPA: hypothetical protein VMG10_27760 [Gemmataceae bacterium]|nr:hypothetical protein [Gemmataceae bacterium]
MRQLIAVVITCTFVLAAGNTESRADIFTYNMSGTVRSVEGGINASVGDHITWTLQYNNSIPLSSSSSGFNEYNMSSPLITNIVNQTTGYHFATLASTSSGLRLESTGSANVPNSAWSTFDAADFRAGTYSGYDTQVYMQTNYGYVFPTTQLSNFQLSSIPVSEWNTASSFFTYEVPNTNQWFVASVDSISTSVVLAPEPRSLTLLLLGAAWLVVALAARRYLPHFCGVPQLG